MTVVFCLSLLYTLSLASTLAAAKSFINPILPGWNSDPSCIFVPEADNTFFCTTSSFLVYPGLPVYASKDLQNWFLISNALHHPNQIRYFTNTSRPDEGIFASTLRYHNGKYHLVTVYYGVSVGIFKTLLFETTDPFNQSSWSVPLDCPTLGYDPDLFFDDDGQSYITASRSTNGGIVQAPIDLATGQLTGDQYHLWNGSGGAWPEGPHVYKKDGFYYLMIAEGGISVDHMETIARSEHLRGPYRSYTKNPILTNRNSSQYFQTVGHADLFQDAEGNWFGAALATRSGPQWENFPMGRETVLFPVTWDEGQWPELAPVRGVMDSSRLPPRSRWLPPRGDSPLVAGPDVINFVPGSSFPKHFLHWSIPDSSAYRISPNGHPYSLGLQLSKANLTGDISLPTAQNRTLVARKQAHTLFTFEVDILFQPKVSGEEAGVTVFLTPQQHLDLGIGLLDHDTPSILFRVADIGRSEAGDLPAQVHPIPKQWRQSHIRLQVQAVNETSYRFTASLFHNRDRGHSREYVFYASATVVSAGAGHFTGSLLGVYATTNGGNGTGEALVSRWRYTPQGQVVGYGVIIPSGCS